MKIALPLIHICYTLLYSLMLRFRVKRKELEFINLNIRIGICLAEIAFQFWMHLEDVYTQLHCTICSILYTETTACLDPL